jgi:hypothetical protein
MAIRDLISILTIVMVIVYGYWLLLMAIGYGYPLFMTIGFGNWILLMAIDYYYSY